MAITIEDIQKKQFSTRSRGYDKFEVDTFLEDIIMQMEQMDSELEELRRKCSSLYETINVYKQTEDSMKEILVIAKEKKDEIIEGANQQAQAILDDAQTKANELMGGMDERVKEIAQRELELKTNYIEFKTQLEAMLKAQLTAIEEFDNGVKVSE
ncbi:MAG: DivIVA domain-containing protein [Clostridiales bacterium]|nr:DivIVA domain-containing protein [Clostridiales bacterium]